MGMGIMLFTLTKPRAALAACFVLLLLAGTKFRTRGADVLLSGNVDRQIYFELFLYAIVALIVARNFLLLHPLSLKITAVELLLGAYTVLTLLSALWSPHLEITAVRALQMIILFGLCFVAVRVLGPDRLLRVFIGSVVVHILVFSLIALTFASATPPSWQADVEHSRFSWFGTHPLQVAALAASSIVMLLGLRLFSADNRKRTIVDGLLPWISVLLLTAVLFATRSRGALVGFTGAVLVLLARKYLIGVGARRTPLSLLGVSCWASLVLVLLIDQIASLNDESSWLNRVVFRGGDVGQLTTLNGRSEIWAVVVELFSQQPILGHGYLASRSMLLEHIPWAGHAHLALAESLLNLGLVGALLLFVPFVITIASSFRYLFTNHPTQVSYYSCVLGGALFLLANSLVSPSFAGPPDYEVLLFFVICLTNAKLVAVVTYTAVPPLAAARHAPLTSWGKLNPALSNERLASTSAVVGHSKVPQ